MRLLEHVSDLVRAALAGRRHRGSAPPLLAGARHDALPAGLLQPDRTTCGSACLVVARMLGDPSYAAWLDTGAVEGRARDPRGRRFADEVLATHVRTNRWSTASGVRQVGWPRALGSAPWAVAHELSATGGTTPAG